ncbi:unnamed protein product [Chondrus crispus]|uniref:Uncharacterized protein n=1 Tax=Chondrus crispus TaxID=2769 RepID=R7QPJ6_CHOCR|nr:unnamed protein product [Chondrus crispus]CDF40412.1 unnamed protein product [Chondrus crispus]|eukprot:XP_005710706.1 unnamed protein product [Chondrus crispus]
MNPIAPVTRYIYSYSGSPQLGYKYVVEIHLAQRSKLLHASVPQLAATLARHLPALHNM